MAFILLEDESVVYRGCVEPKDTLYCRFDIRHQDLQKVKSFKILNQVNKLTL